ncbi:hypothetical protein F4779DRAFT_576168 [Xylariaceae sp. FL0662B]|nr:hypothetical protein F4779DRAFT_576168 [Xylariaceae sp. FL0662B]
MNTLPQNAQNHECNFLDLPLWIRQRIYKAAGLVVGTNLRLAPTTNARFFDLQPSRESFHFTYSILQTCKSINTEVITLICSQNTLVVVHEHVHYGLEFLRRLNPQQCSALTDLFIQLHLEAPVLNDDYNESQLSSPPGHPHQTLIAFWQVVARHILSCTTPQTLNLRLFCDTGVSDTTFAILQPLRDFPGVLRDCEIQLYHQKGNTQARAIAWETSARARGLNPDLRSRPFRFFDLPAEIRRRILEYSDLVTPYKEVYWSANRGFRIATALTRCRGDDCDAHLHQGCRFLSCAPSDSFMTGYICSQRRSGYSSRCHCWGAPRALLLASRSLYLDALQVLYSSNRVIVVPSAGLRSCLTFDNTAMRLDASRFITRHMWPQVLHNLRTIEFVFPAIESAFDPVSGEPYYLDLCFAIDHLRAHADIPKLTIVVNITSAASMVDGDQERVHRQLIELGGNEALVLRAHAQLLDHLTTLRCMRRFFVHLEWAWHWSFEHPRVGFHRSDSLVTQVNRMESWLEKMVMGDDYDGESAGKINEQPSIWLYKVWTMLEHIWWLDIPRDELLDFI